MAKRRKPLARRLKRLGDDSLATVLTGALQVVSKLPLDRALDSLDAIGRRLGPLSGRHRLVLENLAAAMPELSGTERERIGRAMWGHQARLLVETAMLDRLDDGPDGNSRITLRVADEAQGILRGDGPVVFFTAHTGCFELLPRLAPRVGRNILTLFRPPNNRKLGETLLRRRAEGGLRFVASRHGAARQLMAELDAGGAVGVLVDQKFRRGPLVPFFGRPAPTNDLVVKLAERPGVSVLPARCVRLPGNRYRVDIEPPMDLASPGADPKPALCRVNGKVEAWVREHPEQWMWFHRRWG